MSRIRTVRFAVPFMSAAGVKRRVPPESTVGWLLNKLGASTVSSNVTVCAASLAGPLEIPVAHPATVCAPASSAHPGSAPALN